jgi:hypothetical protein
MESMQKGATIRVHRQKSMASVCLSRSLKCSCGDGPSAWKGSTAAQPLELEADLEEAELILVPMNQGDQTSWVGCIYCM